jgi:GntR family transcriptional regulator of abcA and norABC
MWNISLDKNLDTPLYVQVAKHIKELIDENKLEDDKLPSIRQLAKKLDVNNVTIVNAYKQLEQDGYVYSIKGSGTYIRRLPIPEDLSYLEEGDMELMVSGIMPISHDSINFASVSPTPDVFPIEDFKKSLSRVLDRDGAHAFLYPEITGFEPLRESISKFLLENSQIHVNKDQILITSGGQQALDIITKTLIDQGDSILVENPTYSGALSAFESRGARIIGVPMLEDGIDIDALKANIRRYKPKFLYMMTNFQNPTTYSYSEEKKSELLALAYEYEFYIIEDDFLTDLSFKERVDLALKSRDKYDNVIYIKSFSKIFMPGVGSKFYFRLKKME